MSEAVQERADLNLDLQLAAPTGPPLALRLLRVTVNGPAVELRARAHWAAYVRMLDEGLCHLHAQVLDEPAGSEFTAGQEVLLRLALRAPLASELHAEQLLSALVSGAGALAATESWFVTRVLQEVELTEPGETLARGYATLWSDGHRRPAAQRGLPLVEQVAAYAASAALDFERLAPELHRTLVRHADRAWVGLVHVDPTDEVCSVYAVHPRHVPEHERQAAGAAVAALSHDLPVASVSLDPEDGELRVRTSIRVTGDRLSRPLFDALLDECFGTMAQCAPGFDALTGSSG